MKTLGLVVPTRWEASAVLGKFGFKKKAPALYSAIISNHPVLLCISGIGREPARRAAARLLTEGATELVSMGFCGALSPTLRVGDLLTDRIATVDKPVQTQQERQALTERANALAVDMETQAVIEEGTLQGVPIRILRVVSDTFHDDLRPLFGQETNFSAWKIALRLLNPTVWPLALQLRRQSLVAKTRLAQALQEACA